MAKMDRFLLKPIQGNEFLKVMDSLSFEILS